MSAFPQVIAMFLLLIVTVLSTVLRSPVSEPVQSAKETLLLAISKTFTVLVSFPANLTHVLDLYTESLLHLFQNCLL